MMRAAILTCLLASAGCLAQDPASLFEKAPPNIDDALRARVTQFYQLHMEGKFRAADQLVAEDSKDAFFGMNKPRCRAFAIGPIKYFEDFTRAQVVISCDTEVLLGPAGMTPVKRPVASKWKVVDGQWLWSFEPPSKEAEIVTPFGVRKPQDTGQPSGPMDLSSRMVSMDAVTNSLKADRTELTFDPNSGAADQILLTNELPGSVTLSLQASTTPGLSFVLDRTSLNRGEKAVLTVRYEPVPGRMPASTTAQVAVSPTNQVIGVRVLFGRVSAN